MSLVALHRARFDLGANVQIEIEAILGRGRALPTLWSAPGLVGADEEIDADVLASGGMPPMCWRDSGHLFEPFQLREDTDYFVDVILPFAMAEASRRAEAHPSWPFNARLANAFTREPVKRWREVTLAGRPHTVVTGQLRLRSHAGLIDLSTELGGALQAEVVCRKLRYFDEFKALLDSLAEKAAELLLAYDTPVSLAFDISSEQADSDSALHFLMRHVMSAAHLPLAATEILANPHVRLIERLGVISIEEIEEGHADLIADHLDVSVLGNGGPLARFFGGYTPRELPQREMIESHDTPENRYAKALLEHCRIIAQRLENRMGARGRRAAAREAHGWSLKLDELLQHGLWREVGPLGHIPANSQVMLAKRGYKELFRLDVALRMSLDLAWPQGAALADGLVGDIRPVNQVYEYWCFFVLREILQSLCTEVGGGNFLTVAKDGLRIQLAKGRRSECRFHFTGTNGAKLVVSLFYNKRFVRSKVPRPDWSGSYTASFDPDYSVAVRAAGGASATHWLHFDAKYRLEREQAEGLFDSPDDADEDGVMGAAVQDYESELSRVHKQDDLFKMHTYRDGILSTRGAYVLFPGDGVGGMTQNPRPNFFVRHPTALGGSAAMPLPSVGAFPLTPEGSGEQAAAIRELLRGALEAVSASSPYAEERAWFGPLP